MLTNDFKSARFWAWELVERSVQAGDVCVDATLGNGHDACRLCELVGETGLVYGFDIQPEAVGASAKRLDEKGFAPRVRLYNIGHERMGDFVQENSATAILFNLGWLPGGDHSFTTRVETTLKAVETALTRLKPGGVLTVCIYPGHEEGSRERDALLERAKTWDSGVYDVMLRCYMNQPNDPPLLLAVRRKK